MSAPHVTEETVYIGVCPHCHYYRTPRFGNRADARDGLRDHLEICPALAFARLQARWDARDEALHVLVERWRERSERICAGRVGTSYAAGCIDCADDLARAIGDET